MVWMPASHLEPGRVEVFADHPPGVLRLGRFPAGNDELSERLAAALLDAGFDAVSVEDVDAWKHAKLLLNLGNAIDAFCRPVARDHPYRSALEAEARAVLAAAGRRVLPEEVLLAAAARVRTSPVDGREREGGSTWQSAMRGLPSETGHLNGAICRLAERCGLPAPRNQALVELALTSPLPRSVDIATLGLPPGLD